MKTLKKVVAVALALCMCFALCCTAFAASTGVDDDGNLTGTLGSIEIEGAVKGEVYSIYQIFELTYDSAEDDEGDTLTSYSYKVVDEWKDFLSSYPTAETTYFTIDENGYLDPSSGIFQIEDDAEFMAQFAKDALAYATELVQSVNEGSETVMVERIAATATERASSDGFWVGDDGERADCVFDDLALGWYLVDSSLGTLCMLTSTDPDAVIYEKNVEPTISKYVSDPFFGESTDEGQDHDNADNDDYLEYRLVIHDVGNVSNLVIHDYLDEQLDLDSLVVTSVVLYSSAEDTEGEVLHEDSMGDGGFFVDVEGFTLTINKDGKCSSPDCQMESCSFEISISDDLLDGLSSDAYIVITYDVKVVEDIEDFDENLVDEIDNFAMLTYGTASYSEVVETETYSFGFEIFKYTDYTEFSGVADYVITVSAYNDSPGGQQDPMYLCLIGMVDNEEAITYYAIFTEDNENENTYTISQWIPADEVTMDASGPNTTATYTDANGVTQTLPSITEPSTDYTEENPMSYTFNYHGVMPSHDYIVLDELGTAASEDDQANEEDEQYRSADIVIALSDAEFVLSKDYTDENGVTTTYYGIFEFEAEIDDEETGEMIVHDGYLLMDWTTDIDEATRLVSESDGMIYVEGLHDGNYTLTEVKAPDGYNLLADSIVINISDNGTVSLVVEDDDNIVLADKVVEVINNAGAELPGTGGMGVYIFYIVGGCLVVAAAVVLITRRRMSR